ncbi:TetR family transcriptional regulator C-terminal domain-containing protein [Streptomyces sp. A5-4]|uniref:TetR family transcriptional regulator C-terminal domain-containing protein n=1 Tax=Streptomyces sp. A5-4 TaxID=3384771 RepID=UPI003DA9B71F
MRIFPGHHRVRENSTARGELRTSTIFETDLRETLAQYTRSWVSDVAEMIRAAQSAGSAAPGAEPEAAAERLAALVEGISERRLSGSLTLERARELLGGALTVELGER